MARRCSSARAEGLAIAEHARHMQSGADALARAATGADLGARAFVRMAASRQLALHLLPALVRDVLMKAPELDIGIVASDDVSNLLRHEADIAIRHVRPRQTSLVAKKVGEMQVRAFASRECLARHGTPANAVQMLRHRLVGGDREQEIAVGVDQAAVAAGMDPADVRFALRSDDRPT